MTSVQNDIDPNQHESGTLRPLLMTVTQAAALLSIGRTHIYQLFWDDVLTPIHIGRSVRVATEEVENLVRQRLLDAR